MSFRSPWRHRFFGFAVATLRRVLRPFGRWESRFVRSLVIAHNRRVSRHLDERPPETLLLILPRCVKKRGCDAPVQEHLSRCRTCDECPLGDVARLAEEFDIRALVAYRSHIAFALARREKPDMILATACEDRLIKALREMPDVPALLTPLTNDYGLAGRCTGATIDLDWLRSQLEMRAASLPAAGRKVEEA